MKIAVTELKLKSENLAMSRFIQFIYFNFNFILQITCYTTNNTVLFGFINYLLSNVRFVLFFIAIFNSFILICVFLLLIKQRYSFKFHFILYVIVFLLLLRSLKIYKTVIYLGNTFTLFPAPIPLSVFWRPSYYS